MSVELAPRTGLIGRPLVNGLVLPPDLTYDEWAGALRHADMLAEATPWFLVDLMAYGEAHFPAQHTQAFPTAEEDPYGASQSRLKQAAWMASKYPRNQRVAGLSYTHHRVAAELEPYDRSALLEKALVEKLSTRELLAQVKTVQEQARAIDAPSEPVCAAEQAWVPSKDDLEPEWREALERGALDADLDDPRGFAAGYLRALVDTMTETAFLKGRWRD